MRIFKRILGAVILLAALAILVTLFSLRASGDLRPAAPQAAQTPPASAPPREDAPQPEETPQPTPEPPASPTAEPLRSYTFSFAGDCTIGSLAEWQGKRAGDFQSVVGDDYAYPLSQVYEVFAADDLTMVNLEGTFTDATKGVNKDYRFKADAAYAQVLTAGGVEAVSVSNNHAGDFLDEGRADTKAALDAVGVVYTDAGAPLIHELDGGLKLGFVTYNTIENYVGEAAWRESIEQDIAACKAAGCHLIIGFMHWGTLEYLKEPEAWEVQLAHDMVDWGCDFLVGGHAHILQYSEIYNGVPIFYSMGNFCYGGNINPADKDSVIIQASFRFDAAAGTAALESTTVLPCRSSSVTDKNDYRPTLFEAGSEDYERVMTRLRWER